MHPFVDPAFKTEGKAIARLEDIALDSHAEGRKSPVTRKAGPAFADSNCDLLVK